MMIKLSNIMAILLYHIALVNLYYVSNYEQITGILMIVLFLLIILKIKYFFCPKYRKINIILISFIGIMIFSSFYNGLNVQRGIVQGLKLFEIFFFFEYINQINNEKGAVKTFLILTSIYLLINDILAFFMPNLYSVFNNNYFLGNKFQVSYTHIILLALYMYYTKCIKDDNIKRYTEIVLILMTVIISLYTKCTTALVGVLIFLILCHTQKNKKTNAKRIIALLVISCSILLIFSNIINIKPIEYIIVNILHEDPTLTGRTYIYENVFTTIKSNWLLGYGYGNSYEIMTSQVHSPNTQNALMEYWLTTGLIGMLLLILLIYQILKNHGNKKNNALISCICMFCILGSIEITIGNYFFVLIAMVNKGKFKKESVKRKESIEENERTKENQCYSTNI